MARTDAELLIASRNDPHAFRELYDRWADKLLAQFYRRTLDPEVAGDLLAETFAVAFARRARFRDVGRPGAAWLYGIAAKELSHWFRNQAVELKMVRRLAIEVKHDCWVPDALAARVQKLVDGMPAWAGYRVRVDRSLVEGPCGSVTHPDGMGARSIEGMIDTTKHEVLVTVNAARSTLDLLDGPESMQLVRASTARCYDDAGAAALARERLETPQQPVTVRFEHFDGKSVEPLQSRIDAGCSVVAGVGTTGDAYGIAVVIRH